MHVIIAAIGVSTNPCSEVYAGTAAFSEPESRAVQQFVSTHPMDAFITLHSYGQYWFAPFGHANYTYPPDYSTHLVSPSACTDTAAASNGPERHRATGTYSWHPLLVRFWRRTALSGQWRQQRLGERCSEREVVVLD